jgi:hypothetical protein
MKKAGNPGSIYERIAASDPRLLPKFIEKERQIAEKNEKIRQLEHALEAANFKNIETTPSNGVEVHPLNWREVEVLQAENREMRKIAGENSQSRQGKAAAANAKAKKNIRKFIAAVDRKNENAAKKSDQPAKIATRAAEVVIAVEAINVFRAISHGMEQYGVHEQISPIYYNKIHMANSERVAQAIKTLGGEAPERIVAQAIKALGGGAPERINVGLIDAARKAFSNFLTLNKNDLASISSVAKGSIRGVGSSIKSAGLAIENSAKALVGLAAAHPVVTSTAVAICVIGAIGYCVFRVLRGESELSKKH